MTSLSASRFSPACLTIATYPLSPQANVSLEAAFKRTRGLAPDLEVAACCFYVAPAGRYEFLHPGDGGRDMAPFQGIWFCGGWPSARHMEKAIRALTRSQGRHQRRTEEEQLGAITQEATDGETLPPAKLPQSQHNKKKKAVLKQQPQPQQCRILRSLDELRAARLVPTEAEDKQRYEANPELARQRAEALSRLDAARKLQPRKRDFGKRQKQAVRFREGRELTAAEAVVVAATDRACRHYYQGAAGCSTGDKCRFRHDVLP